jgi:hypothetical protein
LILGLTSKSEASSNNVKYAYPTNFMKGEKADGGIMGVPLL